MNMRLLLSSEKRRAEAARIREKYPDRIPVSNNCYFLSLIIYWQFWFVMRILNSLWYLFILVAYYEVKFGLNLFRMNVSIFEVYLVVSSFSCFSVYLVNWETHLDFKILLQMYLGLLGLQRFRLVMYKAMNNNFWQGAPAWDYKYLLKW